MLKQHSCIYVRVYYSQNKLLTVDALVACCLSILVWGYMQRKNDYKIIFPNNDLLGRISLLFSLLILPFMPLVPLGIVLTNTVSMFYVRLKDNKVIALAFFHAWLWATIVILAATIHDNSSIKINLFSGIIFVGVLSYEIY